ncbi:MAG: twin-arginine translocase TatA/TatE family subunit [Amphiplicatus sp.]
MGSIGPWQIVIILLLALLLFGGGGKISSLMGDFAKGIKAFRKGLQDEDKDGKKVEDRSSEAVDVTPTKDAEPQKAGESKS